MSPKAIISQIFQVGVVELGAVVTGSYEALIAPLVLFYRPSKKAVTAVDCQRHGLFSGYFAYYRDCIAFSLILHKK